MMNESLYRPRKRNRSFLKDKQCRIVKKTSGTDDYGAPVESWQYLTDGELWCYARQLSQDMVWRAVQFGASESRFFVLNYRQDIAVGDLVEYGGKYYEITRTDCEDDYHGGDLYIYAKDVDDPYEIGGGDSGGNSGGGDTVTTEDDEPIIGW